MHIQYNQGHYLIVSNAPFVCKHLWFSFNRKHCSSRI